jgi:hypothetical protein
MTQHADGSEEGLLWTNILSEHIALKQKAFLLSKEIAGVWIWGR